MTAKILITGSNAGIGQEISTQLQARGCTVIGTARSPAPAAFPVHLLDLTSDQSISDLAATLTEPIDILINNAGIATITPEKGREEAGFFDLSRDEFARILNVNAIGTFMLTRAMLPSLRKGGRKLIVNISSGLGSIASNHTGGRYAYRASKAALNMITKTFAMDLAGEGFICVAWSPGWVRTRMGGDQATLSPEESAKSLCDLLEQIDATHNGKFLDRQGGELDW